MEEIKDNKLKTIEETSVRILVVDDDPAICSLLHSFLQESGYYVMVAETAIAALGFITLENPDLVLLDLHLPVMSGEDVIELARQKKEQRFALIVLSVSEDIAGPIRSHRG